MVLMILYVHMTCSTCKEALRFLEMNKIAFEARDIVNTPPSYVELEKMLAFQQGNIKKLLNSSGMLYREMGLASKLPSMSHQEILTLMSRHGMLIKRPFFLSLHFGLTGFKKEEWAQRLLSH